MTSLACPTCDEDLAADVDDIFRCPEGHEYTVGGLALTTNVAALRALWMAIRALEDDAASLAYMAKTYGDGYGMSAEARLAESDAAREAAATLRTHASRAQKRLDSLPDAPTAVNEEGRTDSDLV